MPIDEFTGIEDLFRVIPEAVSVSVHKGQILIHLSLNQTNYAIAAAMLETSGFSRKLQRRPEGTTTNSVGFEREDCTDIYSPILISWSQDDDE